MRILPFLCQGLIWALDNPATGPSNANKLGQFEDGPGKKFICSHFWI